VHFLSTLTSQLRSLVGPHSVVLWYDSVTADTGELQWQNGTCTHMHTLACTLPSMMEGMCTGRVLRWF
jgi:hypothetical protein